MRKSKLLAAYVTSLILPLSAQVASQPASTSVEHSANAWMKSPTRQNQWDLVPAPIRTLRDEFWDNTGIALKEPLTTENAGASAVETDGPVSSDSPEIPVFPERAILTGSFKGFRSNLTRSGRSLYTEMTFRAHVIIEAPAGSNLTAETDITICIPGGTVTTPSGQTISYLTQSRKLFLEPSRSYLLFLRYRPEGEFYTLGDDWDITDGTARPNTRPDQIRAESGKSFISGVSTDEIIRRVHERLSQKP